MQCSATRSSESPRVSARVGGMSVRKAAALQPRRIAQDCRAEFLKLVARHIAAWALATAPGEGITDKGNTKLYTTQSRVGASHHERVHAKGACQFERVLLSAPRQITQKLPMLAKMKPKSKRRRAQGRRKTNRLEAHGDGCGRLAALASEESEQISRATKVALICTTCARARQNFATADYMWEWHVGAEMLMCWHQRLD